MPPRSFNGWVQKLMDERGMTLGEAQTEAARIMVGQPSLFQDSERARPGGDHPPQDEVGRSPQRQPRPPAPSKDSGRGTDGTREAGEDRPQASARPEYDPRTSDWPGDF